MVIIQGYNFFFLQISFLGHIITIDKYILSTLFTVLLDKIVCVCLCTQMFAFYLAADFNKNH